MMMTQIELEAAIAAHPATKKRELDNLVVTSGNVPFDADNTSINYMSSVLTIAGFKYAQAVASGTTASDAYDAIYGTAIDWKNANNTVSSVSLDVVATALETAMTQVGTIKTTV